MSINQGLNQQSVDVDINELSEDLSSAVHKVKDIQTLVNSFIDAIVIRKNDETEKETHAIKLTITKVRTIRLELDKLGSKYSKIRLNNIHPIPLGNAGYVSLDPSEEQSGFYKQLLDCYTWLKNIDEDTTKVLNTLQTKGTKSLLIKNNIVASQSLKEMIGMVRADFPLMTFNDSLVVPECCLIITLGKAFVLNITFSGLIASHVIAKSMAEIYTLKPWEYSEHLVFKKLSDVFTCMLLHLIHLEPKDLLHKILAYVNAYRDIFNKKCTVCAKHLNSDSQTSPMLPPLLKDETEDYFYHLSCK